MGADVRSLLDSVTNKLFTCEQGNRKFCTFDTLVQKCILVWLQHKKLLVYLWLQSVNYALSPSFSVSSVAHF